MLKSSNHNPYTGMLSKEDNLKTRLMTQITQKEVAKKMVDRYVKMNISFNCHGNIYSYHKQCALIAVDYLIKEAETIEAFNYWEQVAEQIQIL